MKEDKIEIEYEVFLYLLKKMVPYLHKKVMECLEYAKRNNLVTMGMEKWIETEQYRSILELMKTNIDEFESPNDKLY